MHILKKPDLTDPKLRAKLAKGMGHNYYGEPAWPNDLLYIFPVVILGTIACVVGLAVLDPALLGDKADPFATPLEILPEWYLYPVFQILRVVPNKLLGIALQTLIPLGREESRSEGRCPEACWALHEESGKRGTSTTRGEFPEVLQKDLPCRPGGRDQEQPDQQHTRWCQG